jgi:hypothetical protein
MSRKKPLSLATVSSPEKKKNSSAASNSFGLEVYQQVTKEMFGLWQDQLGRLNQHAEQIQKVHAAATPIFSLYTCGINLWLGFAEACGRGIFPANTSSSGPVPLVEVPKQEEPEPKQERPASFKRPSTVKPKSIEDALPGEMALADLARRVADMERERGLRRPSSTQVISFKDTAGAKMARPSEDD